MQPLKKILLINASPRKQGNTDIILSKILEAVGSRAAAEKININDLKFLPCQACGGCDETGLCILDDDLKPVYAKIIDSDVIILGSPIHFGSLSAQGKMLVDRMQPFWMSKIKLKKSAIKPKKGFLILVSGASKREFFDNAKFIVKNFFAVINAKYSGELFFEGVNSKGEVLDFPGLEKEIAKLSDAAVCD